VATVLEGSVRRAGGQVRITAQLVRTANGFHLWSKTFDRDLTNVLAVQEEVAREVVAALKVKLLPGRAPTTRWMRTSNLEVYDHYLQGQQLMRRGTLEDFRRARAVFERALAGDPEYAPAWAGLSMAVWWIEAFDPGEPDLRKRALEAAERAIALAPEFADGYVARAAARRQFSYDWAGAQADSERGLALSPGDVAATTSYAYLMGALGRGPAAIAAARRATELDPLDVRAWRVLGNVYNFNGDLDLARIALNRGLEIAPGHVDTQYRLGINLVASNQADAALALARQAQPEWMRLTFTALAQHDMGNARESQAALDLLTAKHPGSAAYQIAQIHAWRGEGDRAFEWLGRAYVQRDAGLVDVMQDPLLHKLHGDSRWATLLKKLNLPVD